jgi:hypothetical protein
MKQRVTNNTILYLHFLILCYTLLLVTSCVPHASLQNFQLPGQYHHYQHALDTWTRKQEVFENFEGRLFVQATCISPSFAIAQAKHHQKRLMLTPKEFKVHRQELMQKSQNYIKFLVSIHTPDALLNDLTKFKPNLTVDLLFKKQVIPSIKIESLSYGTQIALTQDFPYLNQLSTTYWIYFPYPKEWNKQQSLLFKLRIASLSATTHLVWSSTP